MHLVAVTCDASLILHTLMPMLLIELLKERWYV